MPFSHYSYSSLPAKICPDCGRGQARRVKCVVFALLTIIIGAFLGGFCVTIMLANMVLSSIRRPAFMRVAPEGEAFLAGKHAATSFIANGEKALF